LSQSAEVEIAVGRCLSRYVAGMLLMVFAASCDVVGPSCTDETGPVLSASGRLGAGATATYAVTSPKHSNLVMRLTWPDVAATLGLRATITNCGGHVGCGMNTFEPAPAPGGPSPSQAWPAGVREMVVDGWAGKTYRIEVVGDRARDGAFALAVTYKITCES
jgi:hypothetical protein